MENNSFLERNLDFVKFKGYGSHLFLFQKLFRICKVESILELGSGYFSTKILPQYCNTFLSIETNKEFYNKIGKNNNLIKLINYPDDRLKILNLIPNYELIFVDSAPKESRIIYIQRALDSNVPYILFHDSEKTHHYDYNSLDIDESYFKYICKIGKWTTLLTKHIDVINKLKEK